MGAQHQTQGRPEWDLGSVSNSSFHENYHPLDETDAFMWKLAEEFPGLAKVTRIGLTAEGRDLLALTISKPGDSKMIEHGKKKKKKKKHPTGPKLSFVLVGAQHGREWVATATSLYLAHALVADSKDTQSLNHLLDVFDFHFIPNPNPDGYVYTWETDRYWYKNRQILGPHVGCRGLDTNRNWGYKWHHEPVEGAFKPDTPIHPCTHWYPGSRPFQAPEVNDIANYVATLPDLIGFLDLRSYGQMSE